MENVNDCSNELFGSIHRDPKREFRGIGNRAKSNLPLQMALYANVWLFPIWLVVVILSLVVKYHHLTNLYKFVVLAVLLTVLFSEALRLYLGYVGNLSGKIPELATFCLMSTFVQLPLEMFLLLDGGTLPSVYETTLNCLMTFLLTVQVLMGIVTFKNLADARIKKFYLVQLFGIKDI